MSGNITLKWRTEWGMRCTGIFFKTIPHKVGIIATNIMKCAIPNLPENNISLLLSIMEEEEYMETIKAISHYWIKN